MIHDVVRAGPELVAYETDGWVIATQVNKPLVVFVHGFTSHGRYLSEQAAYVHGHGYYSAYFNYDSYKGIDTGATQLAERLQVCADPIAKHGLILIGHSMGGLVVRAYASLTPSKLSQHLRGVVLLGTPNNGTLRKILPRIIDWGDAITGIDPYKRLPTCRAAKQLTLSDTEKFVERLNMKEKKGRFAFPILTISGGLPWLEVGEKPGSFRDWFANRTIQRALNSKPNDGLVVETSADLTKVLSRNDNRSHNNSYSAYDQTNHTSLTRNQSIGDVIIGFLRNLAI